jgi:hypothetical protein
MLLVETLLFLLSEITIEVVSCSPQPYLASCKIYGAERMAPLMQLVINPNQFEEMIYHLEHWADKLYIRS